MAGYFERDEHGELIEVFCPFLSNGRCKACHTLSIQCDGEDFRLCEQYKIEYEKKID